MRKDNKTTKAAKKGRLIRTAQTVIVAAVFILSMSVSVFAEDGDPLIAITKFEDFIFSVLKIVGGIACALGVMQIGTSVSTHDPSQRTMGILTLVGGIIIAFAKQILVLIGVVG